MEQLPSRRNETAQTPPQTAPAPQRAEESTAARPATRPVARPADRVQRLPSYALLLHNDDSILMDYVVETICELTPLDQQHAATVMIEAHTSGVALVLTTHRERAELYAEQFISKGLTVTVEPAL